MSDDPWVQLVRYDGPWPHDDPNANLKHDVSLYSRLDPLATLRTLGDRAGIPEGALVRYVLARWASAGAEGLLGTGPSVVERMWAAFEAAEDAGTDEARLEAYEVVRQVVSWLRVPLHDDHPPPPAR